MIAIDITHAQINGNPFSHNDLLPLVNDNRIEMITFFNSCVTDSLVLNTVMNIPGIDHAYSRDLSHTTRYYAINTAKATEFQERFMSDTAPFSMKQLWAANGFEIQSITQTQVVFEDEAADQLLDLVDVNDDLLWGLPISEYSPVD